MSSVPDSNKSLSPAKKPVARRSADQAAAVADPTRRRLLAGGLAAGAGAAVAALQARPAAAAGDPAITEIQDWNRYLGDGVDARPYGTPSQYEEHVVRRNVPWLTADPVSSVNFTPLHELDGIITPNGLCFERHHAGIADVDPAQHRLMIAGLVDKPLVFTMQDILRFPRENCVYFLECAANSGMEWRGAQLNGCQFTHGMVHCVVYTGVKLRYLLEEAGVKTNGKWLLAEGADASAMTRSIPMEKALDDCMVAFKMNGEALRPEQGYPLRLVVPGWEGNMWVKWLRRLEVGDMAWHHREETSKYTDLLGNGKARMFSLTMDAKSVITFPSGDMKLPGPGFYNISGLAWTGRGRVRKVEVSVDGGRSWYPAHIENTPEPMCTVRFSFPWRWDGTPAVLQSRCTDETGYIQPTREELIAIRGANGKFGSIYHLNAIQSWAVDSEGGVTNVHA